MDSPGTDAPPLTSRKFPAYLWLYAVALAASLALLVWGAVLMRQRAGQAVFAAGAAATIATLLAWVLTITLRSSRNETLERLDGIFAPVNERLQHLSVLLNQVSEQQLISERAKAIAFRESERDALRRAIREEMAKRDWDAALSLVNDIEAAFGYKAEADRFREEINASREAEVRRHVSEAIAVIDGQCQMEQWTAALREAERVMAAFPWDPQAQNLPAEIESRRQAHKKQLLDSWHDAVNRHDVDGSIEILKKLDLYLTPAEAESMQETARQVFKDKLLLLGQQFTLAVRDHRWHEAIQLGETIAREFPNSRMAEEVREKMGLLRERASEPEEAGV
jgi:hypothetical protein